MKTLATIAGMMLLFDALGFLLWVLSWQYPQDGFYVGTITAHILWGIDGALGLNYQ